MRLVFMGTPDFAVPSLNALLAAGHDICAVITQPDRPKGRGRKMAFPPVKQAAISLGLPVWQPEKVREKTFIEKIKILMPDTIAVVAFGQMLPEDILSLPPYGCVNLHASLLPKYRGAAPIHHAVYNGDIKTGNTTMLMDKGMDTGAMLLTGETAIGPDDTTGYIHELLSRSGAELLVSTLEGLLAGNIKPIAQNEQLASYAPKLTSEMELIDWSLPGLSIHNKIRALNPWPTAYTLTAGGRVKIFASRLSGQASCLSPGHIAGFSKDGFWVSTGDCLLEITEVQPESKKRMPANIYALNLREGQAFFQGEL